MRIGIIGAGHLGSEIGYTLLHVLEEPSLILLYDNNKLKAKAQALDLIQAGVVLKKLVSFKQANLDKFQDCNIIFYTAGYPRKLGESRGSMLSKNARVFDSMSEQLTDYRGIFLVATNPVYNIAMYIENFLTHAMVVFADARLDNARLVAAGLEPVIKGAHGDYYIPGVNAKIRKTAKETLEKSSEILLKGKGYTQFAPAAALVQQGLELVEANQ